MSPHVLTYVHKNLVVIIRRILAYPQVTQQYNDMLDKLSDYRDSLGDVADHLSLGVALETLWQEAERLSPEEQQRKILDWHLANVEFANAAECHSLSMRHWDLDDGYDFGGAHTFLPGEGRRGLVGFMCIADGDLDMLAGWLAAGWLHVHCRW